MIWKLLKWGVWSALWFWSVSTLGGFWSGAVFMTLVTAIYLLLFKVCLNPRIYEIQAKAREQRHMDRVAVLEAENSRLDRLIEKIQRQGPNTSYEAENMRLDVLSEELKR
jgi:hypothetical protein